MQRDMQQVLERWGRWAASEELCSMVDWPALSVTPTAPKVPIAGIPTCSDEDGIAIDTCIAHLSTICRREDMLILGQRFIGKHPLRQIADAMGIDINTVRKSLVASESFLSGCLVMLGIRLDMDFEVSSKKVLCTQKPMLIF